MATDGSSRSPSAGVRSADLMALGGEPRDAAASREDPAGLFISRSRDMRAAATIILLGILLSAARGEDGRVPARFPVPVRAWFEPTFLDTRPELYGAMNMITSHTDADVAEQWAARGVTPLRWAFGPQSEYSGGKADYYRDQCAPFVDGKIFRFAGVGIDEWNPSAARYRTEAALAAEGYRAARRTWPDNLVVAWVTHPDETFLELLRDGTFDLAIIEGYSFIPDVGGLDLEGIRARCDVIKTAGLADRCIVCFGYIAAGQDKAGRRMTRDALATLVRTIKEEYPEMPGVAFYGYADGDAATPELVAEAEKLALEVYPTLREQRRAPEGER